MYNLLNVKVLDFLDDSKQDRDKTDKMLTAELT